MHGSHRPQALTTTPEKVVGSSHDSAPAPAMSVEERLLISASGPPVPASASASASEGNTLDSIIAYTTSISHNSILSFKPYLNEDNSPPTQQLRRYRESKPPLEFPEKVCRF
ncbi:MAG: hypothetical protein FRX48_08701 [Lasallia pustulata]|uniref:Uncharacterized protein n=1 Tax=Lasallia pustulata TaxID=136370 RepID=A0A5M8PEV6_9LECA|nr:MAG: hypothetical protein FRX48_08701 [Lasallia pustulata]